MATPNDVRRIWLTVLYLVARTIVCLIGVAAIAWGIAVLPVFRQQTPPDRISSELLKGQGFKPETLSVEAGQLESIEQTPFCSPLVLHDAVVLRFAILNSMLATSERTSLDSAYSHFHDLAQRALACSPADPFTWLTLFWLNAVKQGVGPSNLGYLRLSYEYGPNEGWIALWRNQLAMAVFAQLPTDLQNAALDEFVKLVDTGMVYQETVRIFIGAVPAVQNQIAEKLRTANPLARQSFAEVLYEKGSDIDIPDVKKPTRPWQ